MKLVWILTFLVSCTASLTEYEKQRIVAPGAFRSKQIKSDYQKGVFPANQNSLKWERCTLNQAKGLALLVLDRAEEQLCSAKKAQAFLAQGYSVLALTQLPNQKKQGLFSKNRLERIQDFLATEKVPVSGVWSERSASVVSGQLVRKLDVNWAIFAEGLFDLEYAKASNPLPSVASKLATLDDDAMEWGSLAWDYDGVPGTIYLYYARGARQPLKKQTLDFKEVLSAAQITVRAKEFQSPKPSLNDDAHGDMITDALSFFSRQGKPSKK